LFVQPQSGTVCIVNDEEAAPMRVPRTIRKCCALLAPLLGLAIGPDHASAAGPNACSVQARGNSVIVVVCARGLDMHAWREAGEQACGSLAPCNAWIWDDAKKAPLNAPKTDAELTKEQAADAVAIWMNDSGRMVLIRRTGK
jgi:hypothetical protein